MKRAILALTITGAIAGGAPTLDAGAQVPTPAAQTVPIRVLHGPGGSTLALALITLPDGRPRYFVVDTGATNTLIATGLAKSLHLLRAGRKITFKAAGCSGHAQPVHISNWHLGSVRLPSARIQSSTAARQGTIVGLLGSDVLSHYGSVTIDYAHSQLVLGPQGGAS